MPSYMEALITLLELSYLAPDHSHAGKPYSPHAVSPNTTKATRYALNVWRYWCVTNGLKDHTDITKIPAAKLNELLENFYVTVKKSDGSDFLATSLHAIRRGLDRILKNAGVGFSITSSTFSSSTKKLKEKLWVLSKAGMSGARSRNIVYFSLSDEEEMWQAGCLGDDSPITLLSTVVKYNSQYLNMRTLQEHADLMYGDIELLKDPQNQPYFARTDSVKRESRSGSTRVCHGKIYHEHSRGHKQCPYCLLYKYMYIHRPPTQMEAKSPFYLTARKEATDMGSVWYEEQRMGLRSLRGIVPNLAKKSKQLCLIEAGGAALSSADGGVGVAPTACSPGSSLTPASTGAILVLREKMNAPDDVGESKVSSELGWHRHVGHDDGGGLPGSSTGSQYVHRQSLGESGQNTFMWKLKPLAVVERELDWQLLPYSLSGPGLTSINGRVRSLERIVSNVNSITALEAHIVRKWRNLEARFLIPQVFIWHAVHMNSSSEEQSVLSASAVSEVGTIEQNLRAHQCHPAPSPVPKEPQLCGCEPLTHKVAQLGEDQSSDEGQESRKAEEMKTEVGVQVLKDLAPKGVPRHAVKDTGMARLF
ncbi:hypothetical protein PANDA_015569 [Ailuropoda melanoleuca]|uniref:ZMYM2-like/QRICH1 C-terminal domain-containing protein n=1 Tax=Ailuropoda melanoleuca TaxID=9646 RepID=D2HTP4_AILME|nr:hypothetical protein PANDA_015569 [Ailuropoda melanoleuca]